MLLRRFIPTRWSRRRRQARPLPLNDDVWFNILHFLPQSDLWAICLVSRHLYIYARPLLYRVLFFCTMRARELSALLDVLEANESLCSAVTTLIVDCEHRHLEPPLSAVYPSTYDTRESTLERLANDQAVPTFNLVGYKHHTISIATLAERLFAVMPKCINLDSVHVRTSHVELMIPRPWPSLLQIVSNCPSVKRIFFQDHVLAFYGTSALPLLSRLTTMCIDIPACDWSWFHSLSGAPNLEHLVLIRSRWLGYQTGPGVFFPRLRSIEWYQIKITSYDDDVVDNFLRQHSGTLRRLCIVAHAKSVARRYSWLTEDGMLPHLELLRLHNWGTFAPQTVAASVHLVEVAEILGNFVVARPAIVDLALTGFPSDLEADLLARLAGTRIMTRVILATEEAKIRNRHLFTSDSSGSSKRISYSARQSEYLLEVILSRCIIFPGLELENSSYFPSNVSWVSF